LTINGVPVPPRLELKQLANLLKASARKGHVVTFEGDKGVKRATAAELEEDANKGDEIKDISKRPMQVEFEQFSGRFINLQRHMVIDGKIAELHPIAALEMQYLTPENMATGDMAFTPRDTYDMWLAFQKHYPAKAIAGLSPEDFFKIDPETGKRPRITLSQTKMYEVFMKGKLVEFAALFPKETEVQYIPHTPYPIHYTPYTVLIPCDE
jgi:hypothetical protein